MNFSFLRFGIYPKILALLLLLSTLPLLGIAVFNFYFSKSSLIKQSEKGLQSRAADLAEKVSFLLNQAVTDLNLLKTLPPTPKSFSDFAEAKTAEIWSRTGANGSPKEIRFKLPLYKELLFLDQNGKEEIKIGDKTAVYGSLRTVFEETKTLPPGSLYIGHLEGNYVSAEDQLQGAKTPEEAVEGKRYDGIIRFATPVYEENQFKGVVVLGLDWNHLAERILHVNPLENEPVVFPNYSKGNYAYLFDDEGWIIAHPKFWDIRGTLPDGTEAQPFQNISGANVGPVNLVMGPKNNTHYELLKMMQDVYAKKGGALLIPNLGLKLTGPILQVLAYAPIPFEAGGYKKTGIFGGVMVGAKLSLLHAIAQKQLIGFYIALAATLFAAIGLSFYLAGSVTRPIVEKIKKGHQREIALQSQLAEKIKKERRELKTKVEELEQELARQSFEGIIFASDAMQRILAQLPQIAKTDATVLVLGERGTGKEKIALALHALSPRKDKPFLRLNCAAISENLIESELFGHARGAFTGAVSERAGFFEAAGGGTLFLDEIAEMPPALQAKLLRVLQEKQITRVGETKERNVDVRLITATNQNLSYLVQSKKFRADLYDRLHVVSLEIPPLKNRKEDILPLARHFLEGACQRYDKTVKGFSREALQAFLDYDWPGNVRELQNAVERAVIQAQEAVISQETLHLLRPQGDTSGEFTIPDMPMSDLKVRYAKHIRDKYPDRPLKDIRELLEIDWNTLRKYLNS